MLVVVVTIVLVLDVVWVTVRGTEVVDVRVVVRVVVLTTVVVDVTGLVSVNVLVPICVVVVVCVAVDVRVVTGRVMVNVVVVRVRVVVVSTVVRVTVHVVDVAGSQGHQLVLHVAHAFSLATARAPPRCFSGSTTSRAALWFGGRIPGPP